ncbi:MAG TPA: hypothetical protein VIL20_11065 [Sandaracinaceae bacterium]
MLTHIDEHSARFAAAPFFAFLRDPTIDPRQKLAFAPDVTHYVLTFADICRYLLPVHPPADPWQEMVNANAEEDADHWEWFLSDLGTLGLDPTVRLSDAVRRLWSERALRTRMLSYRLAHYAIALDSLGRLTLVHCFESAFKVTIAAIRHAAAEFTAATGKPLLFLGGSHVEAEESHTIDEADLRRRLAPVTLPSDARAKLLAMVDDAYGLFTDFAAEMHDLARSAALVPSSAAALEQRRAG